MERGWNPPQDLTAEEEAVLKLCKKQKLWGFLRLNRHLLLDDEVSAVLRGMYANDPRGGRPPTDPERMALAMLLQVAFGVPDHEVPTLTAVDRRWQVILDCLGATEPVFSQGTVYVFRERAREHGLMELFLNKTVELARTTKGFSHKRLKAIFDSSPLSGAGRVEDTYNLIGRAFQQLFDAAAALCGFDPVATVKDLRLSVIGASSTKAALDVDWRTREARKAALTTLLDECNRFCEWLEEHYDADVLAQPLLAHHFERLEQLVEQDTEPDPTSPRGEGERRLRDGVAPDRQVSLSDPDMRHGRKSKSKTFNGFKRHIAIDLDIPGLVCATTVVPANVPEHQATEPLLTAIKDAGFEISEAHFDRGYLSSPAVADLRHAGVIVVSKPPTPARTGHFSKALFKFDFEAKTVECPAGNIVPIRMGETAKFATATCSSCAQKPDCTAGKARSIRVHPEEQWYQEMSTELSSKEGRALRRKRVAVEHGLARIGQIQGRRARFSGLEKNVFDLQRAAVVANLYVLDGLMSVAA